MSAGNLPHYTVAELNQAIGSLLERGFAPRFVLEAMVIKPQLKKGHLWMTLGDGSASIGAVAWASQLPRLSHQPSDGDSVVVIGKLNYWANRATLSVQVLDMRPSLSTVLRRFEQVSQLLQAEGLLEPARKRALPPLPARIAILTSVPSSALADLLRTAAERWPATRLLLVPVPVQGAVEDRLCAALQAVAAQAQAWQLEAVVLARGGGSREDLALFDSEAVARAIAACPVPVVTGLGHEDDTTVADLVADQRAATPTAAIVALLPDRRTSLAALRQRQQQLANVVQWQLLQRRQQLTSQHQRLHQLHPGRRLAQLRQHLLQQQRLIDVLSPQHWLARGFSLVRNSQGQLIGSVRQLTTGERVTLQLSDGERQALICKGEES